MRFVIDFAPILLFFGAFKFYDIYVATAVIMAATLVQCALIYKLDGKLPMMQKITLLLVVVFGSMTLLFHDERFIKWKPTVLYGALAVGLSVALWLMRKNFLKLLLGSQLTLPDAVWMRLNVAWIVYCVFMAVLNGYVAAEFSTEDWVNFKIWGYVFPVAFIVGQGLFIARYIKNDDIKPDDA